MKLNFQMKSKTFLFIGSLLAGLIMVSCNSDESATSNATSELDERFARNCEVIRANNAGFTGENQDYSMYSEDFFMVNTNFNGSPDTMRLADLQAEDAYLWENFDFEFLVEPVLLPGVDSETQEPNASVRYYAPLKITKAATDSTEERSAVVRMYETFDLNEEGKITIQMYYGDFGAALNYLNS